MKYMKYIKEYKEIDWDDFDYEEENNDLDLPIDITKLSENEWEDLLSKLNIGDCFLFDFRKRSGVRYNNIKGEIKWIYKNSSIGIEFEKNIKGHGGGNNYDGKDGHCWNFGFGYNNLKIKSEEENPDELQVGDIVRFKTNSKIPMVMSVWDSRKSNKKQSPIFNLVSKLKSLFSSS